MQHANGGCPRCDQPLGISWDMWGKYYVCGGCGFTAEDDDQLTVHRRTPGPTVAPEMMHIETDRLRSTLPRR